jgi:hypothetical protein
MIVVAMCEDDMSGATIGSLDVAVIGAVFQKRIDHDRRAGNIDTERRMSEPGNLHAMPHWLDLVVATGWADDRGRDRHRKSTR